MSIKEQAPEAESSAKQAAPPKIAHPTVEERVARGKAARGNQPRSAHADWAPAPGRADPVDVLEEQARSRVPELIPIRYGRMLVSPFTFYRGAAALMAADLADGPRTALETQLCGDAHLANFGGFAAPDGRLVFGLNDFDETLPGPFEWDVKRLAASFAVAGRQRGFSPKVRAGINLEVGRSYRESMRDFAAMRTMDLWYARIDIENDIGSMLPKMTTAQRKRVHRNLEHTRTKDSLKALGKLTSLVDGEPRIASDPPLIVPLRELVDEGDPSDTNEGFARLIRSYRRTLPVDRRRLIERFRYVDAARKVVGVGSVGTRAWIVLLLGRDDDDPLFLQAKEAQQSVLERFVGKNAYSNQGERVVAGQRRMQAASDIFLGWMRAEGFDGQRRDFYFRQLRDWKGGADLTQMVPHGMEAYARLCGSVLARGHARSGDRIAIAAYLGSSAAFDRALVPFAEAYADQNQRDYDALRAAAASGRVTAITGL